MPHQTTTLGWDADWAQALADLQDPGLTAVRVMAVHRGLLTVSTGAMLPVAGALGTRAQSQSALPAVGDWAVVRDDEVIVDVLPRRSLLARADEDAGEEALVANVDLALAVTSLNQDLNLRRLERFVALARGGGVPEVLVVITKGDLSEDPVADATRVSESLGCEAMVISAREGWGVAELRARMKPDHTAALVGMSGVGKSTLVNVLLGSEVQKTLSVRTQDDRGRHATTHRELFVLDDGALVVDTPGLRLPRMSSDAGVEETFADVTELAAQCRFSDCAHSAEPGCAVQAAIAVGELDADRLKAMDKLEREGLGAAERRAESKDPHRKNRTRHR